MRCIALLTIWSAIQWSSPNADDTMKGAYENISSVVLKTCVPKWSNDYYESLLIEPHTILRIYHSANPETIETKILDWSSRRKKLVGGQSALFDPQLWHITSILVPHICDVSWTINHARLNFFVIVLPFQPWSYQNKLWECANLGQNSDEWTNQSTGKGNNGT